MKKYNIITHITTFCNYNCSYCDVVKDKKYHNSQNLDKIIEFINKNNLFIDRFKFFGGEPLLAFKDIKYIIDNVKDHSLNYEIVTNTSLLTDEIGKYFQRYFYIIFFSIDSENDFDFEKVLNFIRKYNLERKIYFNLIISPGKHEIALNQFFKLYEMGFKNFNILPVYYTKIWNDDDLVGLSKIMKIILDKSIIDKSIKLYGFQQNLGYNNSLLNKSIFIDIDLKIYYTDFVSTKLGKIIKNELFLENINKFNLSENLNFEDKQNLLIYYEKNITKNILGQQKLHKIMDYFSNYLNNKK
ncbi:MAG: radical SAM protein [Candidatus Gracilibacteria bacterium]|nr:radical SAM protein [Candidatus Gracilibacteria bacterium]